MRLTLLGAALMVIGMKPALADDKAMEALAKKHNCLACHTTDKKLIGPSYKDVAKKYKGQNVAATLEQKVKKGGQGVWGPVPMPPNAAVHDKDIKELVEWILKMG
ncbi:MAG TPA: c-type cytochrome [Burkholderiales bacterium]|nr:c-type cytochrome [Burkholderiales bacterium]